MARALPNHRTRLDVQLDILSAFARLSDDGRPVSSAQVAEALNVSTNTVALSSGFFVDSGWLELTGRDEFVATEPLVAYHQRDESRPSPEAVALLAKPVRSSWYWQALRPHLRWGPLSRYEALVVLATEGDTPEEFRPQLDSLLDWLEFLRLIRVDGDDIADPQPAPPGATAQPGNALIALEVDLRVTAADLAALSPDQVRALFEAVGTLASLTRRLPSRSTPVGAVREHHGGPIRSAPAAPMLRACGGESGPGSSTSASA